MSTGRVHVRIGKKAAALVLGAVALVTVSTLPAQASLSQPAVVSANPADTSPHIVLDDTSFSVYAFEEVGNTVYAGGRFNQVQDPAKTTTYARQNFVAFDSQTGVVSALNLSFDGMVTAIEATADGTALFIGGAFATVNGITRRGIAKYDLVNNRIDPLFAPTGMRTVSDLKIANGAVIAAGNFTKKVMALNPMTGTDTGAIDITVAGVLDPADETRVKYIAISPNGTRLVATGNFTTVNGQGRRQAFMLNLGATATLSTWHAPRFDVDCAASGARQVSATGVDFSPDGSYFVVVATGGPTGTSGVCDAAARFETANVSSTAAPTWINWTGGDTLYSVAVTGSAVYVGGHQRWLDNPQGSDFAGPGAVSRPGIGAINPVTGKALAWNPTKSREHGTMVLFATSRGLWVGSDGTRFGSEDHAGIGFAPLDPTLDITRPDTVIGSGPSGPVTDRSATFTFSATEPGSFQCSLDGAAYTPCTSPITYANLALTSHTFRVAATDGAYNVDASPAERNWTVVTTSTNVVGNPGFEADTSGWKGDATTNTVSRVAGGRSGGWAAEISNSLAGGACGLDDSPNWVSFTQADPYTVGIWARSDTPGLSFRLRVREYAGGVLQGTVTTSATLTSTWQQVTAAYTPVAPGSSLDVEAYTVNTPTGVCFRADDASITPEPPAPVNQPPAVNAGADQAVTLPNSATLSGAVTDDGLPNGTVTAAWSTVSGPGTVTFADPSQASTTAGFSADGTYVLRLTGSDGALSTADDVTVTVSPAPVNQPPAVNAGADQAVTLPNSATLSGAVTDDGLPSGTVTAAWSTVSGPGTVTFADPSQASTTAGFSADGTYVLRLTGSDGALSSADDVTVTVSPAPVNQPPAVNAGADQAVTLPNTATLSGAVTDDGLPNGTVTAAWSTVSGPGTVTFADPSQASTTAGFSADGTYVLRLTGSDGALSTADDVTVTVTSGGATPSVLNLPIATSADDAEERMSTGAVDLISGDNNLGYDSLVQQTVGLRFPGVALPQGARITAAWVQFQVDEVSTEAASLTLVCEAADSAGAFTPTTRNLSSRLRTTANVPWTPAPWPTLAERAAAQRTPDLAALLQEIVNRPGWSTGNALALIVTGTGSRVAESYDGGVAKAPVLHIEWTP